MSKHDKYISRLNNAEYIEKISSDFLKNKREIRLNLTKSGEPENYVRERYTGRGNRFYNAKESIMKEMRRDLTGMIELTKLNELQTLIKKKDATYYVYIEMDFYLKTPEGDSIDNKVLKEQKIIRPSIRPDLDNYIKLLIDVLHDIVFDDDKRVMKMTANKYYSTNPRTEINIKIDVIKE
jgi:Holliday junction resolvase RusA-like endonuclease